MSRDLLSFASVRNLSEAPVQARRKTEATTSYPGRIGARRCAPSFKFCVPMLGLLPGGGVIYLALEDLKESAGASFYRSTAFAISGGLRAAEC